MKKQIDGSAKSIAEFGVGEVIKQIEKKGLTKNQIKKIEKELNKNPFYVLGKKKGELDMKEEIIKEIDNDFSFEFRENAVSYDTLVKLRELRQKITGEDLQEKK